MPTFSHAVTRQRPYPTRHPDPGSTQSPATVGEQHAALPRVEVRPSARRQGQEGSDSSPPLRVGVWGHYYGANLGDEVVASLVIEAIQDRMPDAEVRCFSLGPDDTQQRYGLAAFPITVRHGVTSARAGHPRWRRMARAVARRALSFALEVPHLWHSYRALRGSDLLVVAGSGQLVDAWWGGAWGHPYTVAKWAMLARLGGVRLVFLSVGAGPLDGRLGRRFVRAAVGSATYISVRDEHSVQVLRAAGVRRPLRVAPDSAFAVDRALAAATSSGRTRVGLNPIAHASASYWGRGDQRRYRHYVRELAGFARALVRGGHDVTLFSSQMDADLPTMTDIVAEIEVDEPAVAARVHIDEVREVDQLLDVIERCDYVVAARFHGALLPLRMGIPTLALSYHPKTDALMNGLGQGRYCVDIDHATQDLLLERFRELCRRDGEIRAELAERVPPLHAEAIEQFDRVLTAAGVGAHES